MALSRDKIVDKISNIVGPNNVVTDEEVLKENSHDRYRKYETLMGLYRLPLLQLWLKYKVFKMYLSYWHSVTRTN